MLRIPLCPQGLALNPMAQLRENYKSGSLSGTSKSLGSPEKKEKKLHKNLSCKTYELKMFTLKILKQLILVCLIARLSPEGCREQKKVK